MRQAGIAIVGAGLNGSTAGPAKMQVITSSSFLMIQALRAIAALLVVVYHAFDMWGARGTPRRGVFRASYSIYLTYARTLKFADPGKLVRGRKLF